MKAKIVWATFILGSILPSCRNVDESNLAAYKMVIQTWYVADAAIANQTRIFSMALRSKLEDPQTKEIASVWFSKAIAVSQYSMNTYRYVDSLIGEIGRRGDSGNVKAVEDLFIKEGAAKRLEVELKKFKANVLAVDSTMDAALRDQVEKIIVLQEEGNLKPFDQTFFKNTPVIACIAELRQVELQIKLVELYLTQFCNSKVPNPEYGFHI